MKLLFKFAGVLTDQTEVLYDARVRKVKGTVETRPGNMDREQIRTLLLQSPPKAKALISFLPSTGCRIGEAMTVKMADLDPDKKPARVQFWATDEDTGETTNKTGTYRTSFLTAETVQLIRDYRKVCSRKFREFVPDSEYLFEGVSKYAAYNIIMRAL